MILDQSSLRFRRKSDGLCTHFHPCDAINDHPAWKRSDGPVWLANIDGFAWVCVDEDHHVCAIPWAVAPADMGAMPPKGDWVSKKGDKSYVYELL